MICDFKVGDEVVCVDAGRRDAREVPLIKSHVYVVSDLAETADGIGVNVAGIDIFPDAFDPDRFRKVQRRDIHAWLATENTIEGPLRTKEPVR